MSGVLSDGAEPLHRSAPRPSGTAPDPAPEGRLLPLRDDLALLPGPREADGSPSWLIHDPAAGRFVRIGWLAFEAMARWHLGAPTLIAERIAAETTLKPTAEDIAQVGRMLLLGQLLRVHGSGAMRMLVHREAATHVTWLTWLVKNYLFFRVPLVKPDGALRAMVPWTGWLYSGGFAIVTAAVALLGLYLASRQWDAFTGSFLWFFSIEGALVAAASLALAKVAHELGHGLTAKRLGCRVPTMGVAFLVLYPVFYTDTTDAWRLPRRRDRLAVGSAGILAELILAAYALLAWSLVPDGLLRSVLFTWATTSWVITLLVNLSPFMRFDGYYLLSDLLKVPNLQERAFALTRWRLREAMFGFKEPPPEHWPNRMRWTLMVYSVSTWAYRFILFLGIALLVYHLFFKLLGILLFVIEIWWFIVRPIIREFVEWARRRGRMRLNRQLVTTLGLIGVVTAILVVPWHAQIEAPAVIGAPERGDVFAATAGQVMAIPRRVGDRVDPGDPILVLTSPDLDHKLAQTQHTIRTLIWQSTMLAQERSLVARSQLLLQELGAAEAERSALAAERDALIIRSPVAGRIQDMAEGIDVGTWVAAGERISSVADTDRVWVESYVTESDLRRVSLGARAGILFDDPGAPRLTAIVQSIESSASRVLSDRELASSFGGRIAVRPDAKGDLVPAVPVYRVILSIASDGSGEVLPPPRLAVGTAVIEAPAESFIAAIWRQSMGVLIRETGF